MSIAFKLIGTLALMVALSQAEASNAGVAPNAACAYDKAAMLGLDLKAFDQDLSNGGGGWRKVGNIAGCEATAADLIAQYRQAHPDAKGALLWHEGQMRAWAGDYPAAIELFERTRIKDFDQWNLYVDATIALLKKDKAALLAARERLSKIPAPEKIKLTNGVYEITPKGAPSIWKRWPPNLDVVDGFIQCFDKTYGEANQMTCRPPPPVKP